MAIFRGTGGAGSANDDVTVTTVTTKASEAAASATSASDSATAAASSASSASGSATTATTKASEASSSKDTATTKASEASASATAAANSATAAATSATAAAASATSALQNIVEDTTPQLGGNLASNGNDVLFADSDKAIFGAGSDLQIYHDGSNSYIKESGDGILFIQGAAQVQIEGANAGENMAVFTENGSCQLMYDNAEKLATTATGVDVTGTLTATTLAGTLSTAAQPNITSVGTLTSVTTTGNLAIGTEDNNASIIEVNGAGAGGAEGGEIRLDMAADHDSTYNHYRIDVHEDDFRIGRAGTTDITLNSDGNVSVSGTVDGRDIATDGTKLDGIEASADVTDTANVTAAGALMDSEVTNLADVKTFDTSDYATSAQGTLATNALPKSGGAMTGAITTNSTFDGRDVATDGSKLDGIAASANNYVHPNHSGEVTSTADGATVIADNVVDEANLKVSNAPVNGYSLTAQSGDTGGLTWALPPAGATGGSTDQIFYENSRVMTANYTITSSKSASTVGPLTINSGVTLTIPSGERLIIL